MVSDIDGLRYTTLLYGTGPGHSEPRALPLNTTLSIGALADAVHASAVPRQWATHGGEDVPVYALGKVSYIILRLQQIYMSRQVKEQISDSSVSNKSYSV